MSEAPTPDATPAPRRRRPVPPRQEKPWIDFPLSWHKRGYWKVKRDGREVRYTADWQESYNQFLRDEEARGAGQVAPSQVNKAFTLRDAVNQFLTRQDGRVASGEIGARQFAKQRRELLVCLPGAVGLTTRLYDFASDRAPELFGRIRGAALARGLEIARQHIETVRATLDHAHRSRLMPPPNYGDAFDRPSRKQVRRQRRHEAAEHGARAWTVDELRMILADAHRQGAVYRAQVWLGLFGAMGAADCTDLTLPAIDRGAGLLHLPRSKTEIDRLIPLPPAVLHVLDGAIAARPAPKDAAHAGRVFLTRNGLPPVRVVPHYDGAGKILKVTRIDTINLAFKRRLGVLGLKRRKAGFYTLRAMFSSLATGHGADPDLLAVVMGQQFDRPIREYYLRGDLREKLVGLVEHVFAQVYPVPSYAN